MPSIFENAYLRMRRGLPPVPKRKDWLSTVNQPQVAAEEAAVRRCLMRRAVKMGSTLQLGPLRKRGHPKKQAENWILDLSRFDFPRKQAEN